MTNKCPSCKLELKMHDQMTTNMLCGNRRCPRFGRSGIMNNLEKAKLALRSKNDNKLKWIVITLAGSEARMEKLSKVGAAKMREWAEKNLLDNPAGGGVRVDMYYENPIQNTTTGGPQVPGSNLRGHQGSVVSSQPQQLGQTPTSPLSPRGLNKNATYT